jgi:hypothetical protein
MSALRLRADFGKSPSHCLHTSHSVDDPDSAHGGIAELEVIPRGISDHITRRMRSADRVGRTITLLGASVGNLENESTVQMALPFESRVGSRNGPTWF